MPSDYQPLNINTGSAQQAIASTPNVTPNLENLMQGITSGFISLQDIQKRAANGPLEAATRNAELADVQQIRPLAREAQTAQLQNLQAKQAFEAESLPILNDIKREQLKAEYNDVLQHGVPSSVLKVFNATVPGLIPFNPDQLYDKKTGGQLNTGYALELIGKAMEKAEKLKLNAKFTGPVKQSTTGPKGEVKETTTIMNQLTGEAVGNPIVTDTKAADEAKAAQVQTQTAEGLRKEFHQNDTIQAFNKVDSAVNKIRLAATPTSTPFQDMSAIFSFLKVLDPGSTVREGEYATVQNSRGWPDAFRGYYNKAVSGQKLTVDQKSQLLASAEQNYQGQLKNALPAIRQFSDLEDEKGLGPGSVVPIEFREKLKTTPAGTTATVTATAGAATPPPVIDITDRAAAAAQAKALPPNIPFFKWAGSEDLYKNPNYRP